MLTQEEYHIKSKCVHIIMMSQSYICPLYAPGLKITIPYDPELALLPKTPTGHYSHERMHLQTFALHQLQYACVELSQDSFIKDTRELTNTT